MQKNVHYTGREDQCYMSKTQDGVQDCVLQLVLYCSNIYYFRRPQAGGAKFDVKR